MKTEIKQGDKIRIIREDGSFEQGEFHRYGQSRFGAIAFFNGQMRFVDEQSICPELSQPELKAVKTAREFWIEKSGEEPQSDADKLSVVMMREYFDFANQFSQPKEEAFIMPTDKQLIDIAILFNDGKLEGEKLADMMAMTSFVLDRLFENRDVSKKSSKEV